MGTESLVAELVHQDWLDMPRTTSIAEDSRSPSPLARHTSRRSSDNSVLLEDGPKTNDSVHEVSVGDASAEKLGPEADLFTSDTAISTKAQRVRAHIQFITLCWTLYLQGWNDGTMGPLLPRIQRVYKVNFAVVSLLFVFACIGYLTGAFLNVVLNARYGFGKVIVLGSVLQLTGYAIECAALPFPVFVLGYVICGIGMALQAPQANGYVASLKDSPTKLGILHACWGAGGLSAPIVATQFAQLPRWSFHFLVSFGMALVNTILVIVVFRLKSLDECLAQIGQSRKAKSESKRSHLRQILGSRVVHLLAVFQLVYVGVEITIGGWIVTYIIDVRGGGPSSGYISSGYFGGMVVGRIALLWINKKIGERRVLFLYALMSIGLELIIWLVPSLIGDAVAVSIIGVVLGPMYPIVINHAGRVLPAELLTGALGWISASGQAGSALVPFMTGAIASRVGISALQPLLVAATAFMTVLWAFVPSGRARGG